MSKTLTKIISGEWGRPGPLQTHLFLSQDVVEPHYQHFPLMSLCTPGPENRSIFLSYPPIPFTSAGVASSGTIQSM